MATSGERVQDELIQYAVRLDRFNEGTAKKVGSFLSDLADELEDSINKANLAGTGETRRVRRLQSLLKQVTSTIEGTYDAVWDFHRGDLRDVAAVANVEGARVINAALTVDIAKPVLTAGELKILSSDPIVRGRPSSEWWKKQGTDLQGKFAAEMRLGIATGETNEQLVQRVIGKSTGNTITVLDPITGKVRKVRELKGGIMEVSRREARTLVRTSAQTVSNETLFKTYQANSRILRGVAALVTLDSRTTKICMSRSGGVWDINTGEPLPESTTSIGLPSPPPWHWNCRTTMMPVTKSWDELRKAKGQDKLPVKDRRKLDTVPRKERASIDGKVAGHLDYEQWLKTKDTPFQVTQLGPGRWKLWDDGKIKLADLTDFRGRTLTLEELRNVKTEVRGLRSVQRTEVRGLRVKR